MNWGGGVGVGRGEMLAVSAGMTGRSVAAGARVEANFVACALGGSALTGRARKMFSVVHSYPPTVRHNVVT